jgi:CBS domain-containing protein
VLPQHYCIQIPDAIITEHDIVKLVASGKDAASTTVESIMTKGPVCVIADAKPVEILETMKKKHVFDMFPKLITTVKL